MPTETDPCSAALATLLAKDLAEWTGLPARCTLETLRAARLELDEDDDALVANLGDDRIETVRRAAKAGAYAEPMIVDLRDGAIVRIAIQFPELPDVPALLAKLGPPDGKLDTYMGGIPVVKKDGEWVWATRGLSLMPAGDRARVMELIVYAPTTVEQYRKRLRRFEEPREEGHVD